MKDIYIIQEKDILETRFNENDVTIKVKDLQKLDFIPSNPKLRIEFNYFWEDFLTEFLSINSIKDFTSEEKQRLTTFVKHKIKTKLLKQIS